MLDVVEKAGVFHGYLEDLAYTPKTLKALFERACRRPRRRTVGALARDASGTAQRLVLGQGAGRRWGNHRFGLPLRRDHPQLHGQGKPTGRSHVLGRHFGAPDSAPRTMPLPSLSLRAGRWASSRSAGHFRGGMDLRDEVSGTQGTIWTNHFLRTGFEMFTAARGGYVAEKAETESGWLFPVGDEVHELGYTDMFTDMFAAMESGKQRRWNPSTMAMSSMPCLMPASNRPESQQWEPIVIEDWRAAAPTAAHLHAARHDRRHGRRQRRAHARQ